MCLEDASGSQVNRLEGNGMVQREKEPARSEDGDPVRNVVLGCSGCAEIGYCRRGLGQEELSSDCVRH